MSDMPVTKIISIDDHCKFKFHVARGNGVDQPFDVKGRDKNEWLSWNS